MANVLATKLVRRWRIFWLWRSGYRFWGRVASRLAAIGVAPYRHQTMLAGLTRHHFISPQAEIIDIEPKLGAHVFVADRAVIARWTGTGAVTLEYCVQIGRDCMLELFEGGSISIGSHTAIQKGCVLLSAVQPIVIHARAQLACYCALYSFDHGIEPEQEIFSQPLTSKGPIVIEEDAWLGVGVKVLSGVTIGRGAVVGAGSVVTRNIPPYAIAAGVPARVIKYRGGRGSPTIDALRRPEQQTQHDEVERTTLDDVRR